MPHGVGSVGGGEASAGLGRFGGTAQGQVGVVTFNGENGEKNAGFFASGVAAVAAGPFQAGAPNQGSIANGDVNPIVVGAYAGVGAGFLFTNATNITQLGGPFQTFTLSIPIGSVAFSFGGGVWTLSITGGPGAYAAATSTMEKYAQARIGGNAPAQTTGAWAVTCADHVLC